MSRAGLSVLIPERGRSDLLEATLEHLERALEGVCEPVQTLVWVNGAARRDYRGLQRRYPWVAWHFSRRALGFHGAMARLLAKAHHDWVYLLNSDMRLAQDALTVLLRWRAADVFAIASQIHLADPAVRREETGFTCAVFEQGQLHLHDRSIPDLSVRGHLYAGGGASLFQTAVLRRVWPESRAYAPFYFEDADWSMQAMALGYRVLFCPRSQALHEHQGTVRRYHTRAAIEQVKRRNLGYFRERYQALWDHATPKHGQATTERPTVARLLRSLWTARSITLQHQRAYAKVQSSTLLPALDYLCAQRYPHADRFRSHRPRVLIVTPFAPWPPAHGGARRTLELVRASAEHIDWLLLHDEATASVLQPAGPDDALFREIHPVHGRPETPGSDAQQRIAAHAHAGMCRTLTHLLRTRGIHAVVFEHLECLALLDLVPPELPVIWDLHDVGRTLQGSLRSSVQRALARVHTLVLSTRADLGYWSHPRQILIENGVRRPAVAPAAAPVDGPALVLAPFRYPPNLIGIRHLLREVWPTLRQRFPQRRLLVLGGPGARRSALDLGQDHWPEGVELIDRFVEPAAYYAAASLCLNPQINIEGSALKVIEALAHGRIMISTHEGARGFESLNSPALWRVSRWSEMIDAVTQLWQDQEQRRQREAQAHSDSRAWCWSARGAQLCLAIRTALGAGEHGVDAEVNPVPSAKALTRWTSAPTSSSTV